MSKCSSRLAPNLSPNSPWPVSAALDSLGFRLFLPCILLVSLFSVHRKSWRLSWWAAAISAPRNPLVTKACNKGSYFHTLSCTTANMTSTSEPKCPISKTIYLPSEALSLSHHSLVGHDLLDVSIEECDDDSLTVNTDVFSCAVCESNHARAITIHFLHLKPNQSPDQNPKFLLLFSYSFFNYSQENLAFFSDLVSFFMPSPPHQHAWLYLLKHSSGKL